jgi:hypothetical protein
LILEADKSFEARRKAGDTSPNLPENAAFLKNEDRQLFERLVQYSMLKANMDTTLTAKVRWKPDKAKVAVGPLVVCRLCKLPRSVTVMAPDGVCGLCASPECRHEELSKSEKLLLNVSANDTEKTEAT